jgi:hypothetical protein
MEDSFARSYERETSLAERQSSFVVFARLYIVTTKHPPAAANARRYRASHGPGGTGQNSDLASQSLHIRGSVRSAAIEAPTPQLGLRVIPN